MKIETSEKRDIIIKEIYNGVKIVNDSGEEFLVCLTDSGFEFKYHQKWYEAKKGKIIIQ